MIYTALTFVLIEMAFTDIKTQTIPNRTVLLVLIIGALSIALNGFKQEDLFSKFIGFFAAGGIFYLIAVLSRGGMGGGDIKLIAALGLCFGFAYIIMIMALSFVIGAVASVFLIVVMKKSRKTAIPFGPFIAMAAYICMIYGNEIISFYV